VSSWLEAHAGEQSVVERARRRGDPHAVHLGQSRWWWRVQGCICTPTLGDPAGGRFTGDAHQHPVTVPGGLSWWSRNIDVFVAVFAQGETRSPCWKQRRRAPRSGLVVATLHAGLRLPQRMPNAGPSLKAGIRSIEPCSVFGSDREPSPTLASGRAVGAGKLWSSRRRP